MKKLLILLALPWVLGARPAAAPPNVIFILADDLGYGDLGCYGQKRIKTPNLDALAAAGLRFTNCYAGSTVCAPSRCTLMTGMHTGHSIVRGNLELQPEGQPPLPADTMTVARLFKQAGYATTLIGKWGLGGPGSVGEPQKQGFDSYFGYLCQRKAHEYYPESLWRTGEKVPLDGKTYSHDLFAAESLDWVRKHKDGPFFLYLPFTIPHGKYQVPDLAPYADESWPAEQKTLAAMITRMDRDIGRLMELLKELKLDGNTLVFFTSDNGAGHSPKMFASSGELRGMKRDLYEGGIRTPMIARWPGKIAPGTVSDQPWAFWDFLPTMAELLGVKAPAGLDGVSVLPALTGGTIPEREYFYWEFHEKGFSQALRMGSMKAVKKALKAPIEIFDLAADPSEKADLAASKPELVEKAAALFKSARTESELWPIKNAK